jgi:hypothetical protein
MRTHSFHIPVMGVGFTIDTPLKVSQYGIDSVIALADDIVFEKLRKFYSEKYRLPYNEIDTHADDYRAKRITSYLNLINKLAENKFEAFKNSLLSKGDEIKSYFEMLPSYSSLKQEFLALSNELSQKELTKWLKEHLSMGSIDVNIMTKVDKVNYKNKTKLPVEYNDAHAALRGYALSDLNSSVIFSAGFNPKLYGYIEQFEDFYPSEHGCLKKKIVLKVSDYRSAMIQGKFLAKKGLWVSEYRIESGLNCGGHAFATDGYLLGPILDEFKEKRSELIESTTKLLNKALQEKNRVVPNNSLSLKISAQGGVGTAEEHQFLIDHYQVDSVGWGTPFLLVPEATTVDSITLDKLVKSKESDLYLSDISPLGVPFNNLKGNTKDFDKEQRIDKGRPGSSCPKKYLALNSEFEGGNLCTASRKFQHLQISALKKLDLSVGDYQVRYNKIVEKSCICVGLGTSALLKNKLNTKKEGEGVSVCPGPNMAYFDKIVSLKEMVAHIYGKQNLISRNDRPIMFIKELNIYSAFLKNKVEGMRFTLSNQQKKYLQRFILNLNGSYSYYEGLFQRVRHSMVGLEKQVLKDFQKAKLELNALNVEIQILSLA